MATDCVECNAMATDCIECNAMATDCGVLGNNVSAEGGALLLPAPIVTRDRCGRTYYVITYGQVSGIQ